MIVNSALLEAVPPVLTVTVAVPCVAIRPAAIGAVNCVALTNTVVRAEPFHKTTELAAKLDPFTVNVNGPPPACVADGLKPLIVRGLGAADTIVKAAPFDAVPPAFTVTVAVP